MQNPVLKHPASPTKPSERIDTIDILRGLALFIVLIINAVTEFRVSIFEQFLADTHTPSLNRLSDAAILALHTKGFILFSFLFGVGLAIQFERLAGNRRRLALLLRRLAALLAIGLFHLFLIWNGDILTEYAVAAFIALPFLFGPPRLLTTAATLFLGYFIASPFLPFSPPFPDRVWMAHHIEEARRIYGAGGFAEILVFRIEEARSIAPLHLFALPRTLALFLLGAFVWRTGFFRRAPANNLLLIAAFFTLAIGTWLTIVAVSGKLLGWPLNWQWDLAAGSLAQLLLAVGYGAAIVAAANYTFGRQIIGWAGPLGRMAFTNYVVQSIALGWIFYGYGLGLFGRMSVAESLAIAILIYAAQIVFSRWWLFYFSFGPLEWLWRSLMYGQRQPLLASRSMT